MIVKHSRSLSFIISNFFVLLLILTTTMMIIHNNNRSTNFFFVEARKALGGSGGLHNRGSPRAQPNTPGNNVNDPTTMTNIHNNGLWEIPPLDYHQVKTKLGKKNRDVAQYIADTLSHKPLLVQLRKKPVSIKSSTFTTQEKFRAQVSTSGGSSEGGAGGPGSSANKIINKKRFGGVGNKLRSVWFVGSERFTSTSSLSSSSSSSPSLGKLDLLNDSYEHSCTKLFPSHFVLEVFLPKTRACRGNGGGNPLITYSIPFGQGTTSPKTKVSQSNGIVTIYPNGRRRTSTSTTTSTNDDEDDMYKGIEIGHTGFHLKSGPPLVDKGWARGKRFFYEGRRAGLF